MKNKRRKCAAVDGPAPLCCSDRVGGSVAEPASHTTVRTVRYTAVQSHLCNLRRDSYCAGKSSYPASASLSFGLCLVYSSVPFRPFHVVSVRQFGRLPARGSSPLISSFFQTPPRGGHPYFPLTLPAAQRVAVFPRLVIFLAGSCLIENQDLIAEILA